LLSEQPSLRVNMRVIEKYGEYYSALKFKYNQFKRLLHNREINEHGFIANRDTQILQIAVDLSKENPKKALKLFQSVKNLILVVKKKTEV